MPKNSFRFQELHNEYVDCLEYLATYGLDSLSEKEQEAARSLAVLAEEFIEVMADNDLNFDEDSEVED